jgi:hypothetical protein
MERLHRSTQSIISSLAVFFTLHCASAASASVPSEISGLHVSGNTIVNGAGQTVRLNGVNHHGSEYRCVDPSPGFFDGPSDDASVEAIALWNAKAVRVPLNETCWLGINGVSPDYSGSNYQNAIAAYVDRVNAYGLIPILDLHWSAEGLNVARGQQPMPNRDHSVDFWTGVANRFKNNTSVVFDIFNEPYPDGVDITTATWQCWRDGSPSCPSLLYSVAGMQELVNAIRATGATNLILAGGLKWANSLSQWNAYKPADSQNNLAASWHVYNFNSCRDTTCWDNEVAPVAQQVPLVVGEFGPDENPQNSDPNNICIPQETGFTCGLMDWLDARGASYVAHAWNLWGKCRDLITDWSGTPTDVWGEQVKSRFAMRSCNLIMNPQFNNGTTNWNLQLINGAAAQMTVISPGLSGDNALKITPTSGGTEDWHIQIQQGQAVETKNYRISFKARADNTKSMRTVWQQNGGAYEEYFSQSQNLTTTAAQFGPYSWNSARTDPTALFKFYVGNDTIPTYLDKVIVTRAGIDTAAPTVPANLTASAVSSSQIDLQWSASTDNIAVTRYLVSRGGTQIAAVPGTRRTFSDKNLEAGTTYSYSVQAADDVSNTSAASNSATATTSSNLIDNGEFDNSTTGWNLQVLSGAAASMAIVTDAGLSGTNALRVTPTSSGSEDWHIQVQYTRGITSGKTYQISFMAKADQPKTIRIELQQNGGSYTEYWSQSVNVGTAAASFGPYTFNCQNNDPTALLKFLVGANTIAISIDKVVMTGN